jgi:hypothetical protein
VPSPPPWPWACAVRSCERPISVSADRVFSRQRWGEWQDIHYYYATGGPFHSDLGAFFLRTFHTIVGAIFPPKWFSETGNRFAQYLSHPLFLTRIHDIYLTPSFYSFRSLPSSLFHIFSIFLALSPLRFPPPNFSLFLAMSPLSFLALSLLSRKSRNAAPAHISLSPSPFPFKYLSLFFHSLKDRYTYKLNDGYIEYAVLEIAVRPLPRDR